MGSNALGILPNTVLPNPQLNTANPGTAPGVAPHPAPQNPNPNANLAPGHDNAAAPRLPVYGKNRLLALSDGLALPKGATFRQKRALDRAVRDIHERLSTANPSVAQLRQAQKQFSEARDFVVEVTALTALAQTRPTIAERAGRALDAMRDAHGGGLVTQDRINAARTDLIAKNARVIAAEQALANAPNQQVAAHALTTARQDAAAAQAVLDTLGGYAFLRDALADGTLSNHAGTLSMPQNRAIRLVDGFAKTPALAKAAVEIARMAKHPDAVARALEIVADQAEYGFADENGTAPHDLPADFGEKILRMAGACGPGYIDRFSDYVDAGGLTRQGVLPDTAGDSIEARGSKRAMMIAQAAMHTGTLRLETDQAKQAIGDLLFHPEALSRPTTALNQHVLRTLDVFSNAAARDAANERLGAITRQPAGAGATLVNKSHGFAHPDQLPAAAEQIREAVVASMFQQVFQGNTPTCFAVAPLVELQRKAPLEMMDRLIGIAADGTFVSDAGTVPAITSVLDGRDPLMHSLEATLATAMARSHAHSMENTLVADIATASNAFQGGLNNTAGALPRHIGSRLTTALTHEFKITFDPSRRDGNVDGRFVLRDSHGDDMLTRADLEARVVEIAQGIAGMAAGTPDGDLVEQAVQGAFMTSLDGVGNKPWDLGGGGLGPEAYATLHGSQSMQGVVAKAKKPLDTATRQSDRAKEILTGIASKLGKDEPDMQCVFVNGEHGFNLLPNAPSMAALREGGRRFVKALDKQGAAMRDTPLSVADTQRAYDAAINATIASLTETANTASAMAAPLFRTFAADLTAGRDRQRPTAGMRPADLQALVEQIVNGANAQAYAASTTATLRAHLINRSPDTQVTIADTNWGDPRQRTVYVAAPDPFSGLLHLWKKTEPSGELELMDAGMLQNAWILLKEK